MFPTLWISVINSVANYLLTVFAILQGNVNPLMPQ